MSRSPSLSRSLNEGKGLLTDLTLQNSLQSIVGCLGRPGGRQDGLERHTRARATPGPYPLERHHQLEEVLSFRWVLIRLMNL